MYTQFWEKQATKTNEAIMKSVAKFTVDYEKKALNTRHILVKVLT
jgi:hypothetical protein